MKSKLQVRQPDGTWRWVKGWGGHGSRELVTTTRKADAVPPITFWHLNSLKFVTKLFPDQVFRLAGQLKEEV